MKPETREKLEQTVKHTQAFLENIKDDLEELKKRKKKIEAEARERRRKAAF